MCSGHCEYGYITVAFDRPFRRSLKKGFLSQRLLSDQSLYPAWLQASEHFDPLAGFGWWRWCCLRSREQLYILGNILPHTLGSICELGQHSWKPAWSFLIFCFDSSCLSVTQEEIWPWRLLPQSSLRWPSSQRTLCGTADRSCSGLCIFELVLVLGFLQGDDNEFRSGWGSGLHAVFGRQTLILFCVFLQICVVRKAAWRP